MRRVVLLVLVATLGVGSCSDDAAKRDAQLRREAEHQAALLTDCRLLITALAHSQAEHRRAAGRDDFDRTGFEIEAFTRRARLLGCPVVSS
jgi:hypothetical protein